MAGATAYVVDASVAVKWFFVMPENAGDDAKAQALLESAVAGSHRLIQPPHWHAEVAAVLARVQPERALDDVADLLQLACVDVEASPAVLLRATELAATLRHHLFDTLYHAVALERHCTCLTADARYYRKARALGSLTLLRDWTP